jgi:hypothetical protein
VQDLDLRDGVAALGDRRDEGAERLGELRVSLGAGQPDDRASPGGGEQETRDLRRGPGESPDRDTRLGQGGLVRAPLRPGVDRGGPA